MTYDYHSPTSFITGPVAPLNGAGISSEYDVSTAVEIALKEIPKQKVVMGVPLYGYEWETILPYIRSAVIPDSGVIASNNRAEQFLSSCASCSAGFDSVAQESYLVYRDEQTGTYHQMSFPDTASMQAKIAFANEENIGGLALWALGYEGKTILQPLRTYIHTGK
jgi:spore germination protein YaaH